MPLDGWLIGAQRELENEVLTLMFEPSTRDHLGREAEIPLQKTSGISASQNSPQKGPILLHNFGDGFLHNFLFQF